MAGYKVIQDIEAEDKLFGPFTLKQFIFACISVICLYLCFIFITKGLAIFLVVLLPPAGFFAALAWPWSPIQSNETWLLAKLRFFFKPRKRIWDQSGIKDLVTITVPKKVEEHLTKDFSQTEVRSRLKALANTIDSRGWAVKNVDVNLFAQPAFSGGTDRLITASNMPQDVSPLALTANDDMFDQSNNPTSQNFDRLIAASSQNHREAILAQMQQPAKPATGKKARPGDEEEARPDYWFMHENISTPQRPGFATGSGKVVLPGSATQSDLQSYSMSGTPQTADEAALLDKIHREKAETKKSPAYGHMKTIKPLSEQLKEKRSRPKPKPEPPVTATPDPAILELASNDDLNVATIARQANKKDKPETTDEVVISLH